MPTFAGMTLRKSAEKEVTGFAALNPPILRTLYSAAVRATASGS